MVDLVERPFSDQQKAVLAEWHKDPEKFIVELVTAIEIISMSVMQLQVKSMPKKSEEEIMVELRKFIAELQKFINEKESPKGKLN